jgi:DNA-binding transcriptional LysR family regulator
LRDKKIKNIEALASQIFLTTDTRPGDWENWLKAAGQPELRPRHFLRFDHFFVTLQAVVDGMGIGIGTFPTLNGDKAAGRIKLPFANTRVMGSTYFILVPLDADKPVHLRQFVEWLVSQGKSGS